jgi:hypothetical protein
VNLNLRSVVFVTSIEARYDEHDPHADHLT